MVEWKYISLLVSYCSDISEACDMSAVQHGVAAKRPSVSCMMTQEDIISGWMASEKSVKNIRMVRSRCTVAPKNRTLKFGVENERVKESKVDSSLVLLNTHAISQL